LKTFIYEEMQREAPIFEMARGKRGHRRFKDMIKSNLSLRRLLDMITEGYLRSSVALLREEERRKGSFLGKKREKSGRDAVSNIV